MEVEIPEQLFLDSGANSITEERAVGYDYCGATRLGRATQLAHDQLEKK